MVAHGSGWLLTGVRDEGELLVFKPGAAIAGSRIVTAKPVFNRRGPRLAATRWWARRGYRTADKASGL